MKLDLEKIPKHIAIIMDGNGRWAKQKGFPRIEGHRSGVHSVRAVVKACGELGVEYLTLYAFSAENWTRPKVEVSALMQLLKFYLKKELAELNKKNVQLKTIGDIQALPASVYQELEKAKQATANNTGLKLVLALNYGGRQEIIRAIQKVVHDVSENKITSGGLNEEQFASYLDTAEIPDPDVLIRTSGEMRISNFLNWQVSYTELVIKEIYWPDFRKVHLEEAILEYQNRQRRFGGL